MIPFTDERELRQLKVKMKENKAILKPRKGSDYVESIKKLATIVDTDNGFEVTFHNVINSEIGQDRHLKLDYSEAEYLYVLLKAIVEQYEFKYRFELK